VARFKRRMILGFFVVFGTFLIGSPRTEGATREWHTVILDLVKVDVPKTWQLARKCEWMSGQQRMAWLVVSPNRYFRLRVGLAEDKGEPFAKLAELNWSRLVKRIPDLQVLSKETLTVDGNEAFSALARATLVRKKNPKQYLVSRLMYRMPAIKAVASLTLEASGERIDGFKEIMARVTQSFGLAAMQPGGQGQASGTGGAPAGNKGGR
jgi:hypothetical protein